MEFRPADTEVCCCIRLAANAGKGEGYGSATAAQLMYIMCYMNCVLFFTLFMGYNVSLYMSMVQVGCSQGSRHRLGKGESWLE